MDAVDTGWSWMVVLGSFGSTALTGVYTYSVGLYHLALLDKYHGDIVTTAWIGAIFSALSSIAGPLASVTIDRFNCRVAMMTSGILLFVGFVTTAFTANLYHCFFTLGLVAGCGIGMSYTTAIVVVGYNFHRKLNIASAMAVSGIGSGIFALSPLIQFVKETYGFTGLFLISAGLGAHNCVFGALYRPSKIELEQKRKTTAPTLHLTRYESFKKSSIQYGRVYSKPGVICFSLSFFCFAFGTYLLYYHLPGFCVERGSSASEAALVMSVSDVSSLGYRLLAGVASSSDDVDELTVYFSNVGLVGLAAIIIPRYAGTFQVQALFAVILGAYTGGLYALLNSIAIRLVGLKDLSPVFGGIMFSCGAGQLVGPVVAGRLLETGLGYEDNFAIAGVSLLVSSFLAMLTPSFKTSASFVKQRVTDTVNLDIEEAIERKSEQESTIPDSNKETEVEMHALFARDGDTN